MQTLANSSPSPASGKGRVVLPIDRRLPCLTGSRFVAAFLVVLFSFGWLAPAPRFIFDYGPQAISFFFILSGLVLTYRYHGSLSAGKIGWAGFFNLRLARIIPVHLAAWLVATILFLRYAWRPSQGPHPISAWITGLFCVQVYLPSAGNLFRWNGQAWTISCELFFCALFPFLLLPLARRLKSTVAVVGCMIAVFTGEAVLYFGFGTLFSRFLRRRPPLLAARHARRLLDVTLVFPPLRLGEFVVGMCLGLLYLRRGSIVKSAFIANLLLAMSVVSLIALKRLPWTHYGSVIAGAEQYVPYIPVLVLMIVALASGLTVVTPLLESRYAVL